ncbi:MAG: hypothetical protein IJH39_05605 [Clostridia bacterium]|nr:hypothetical protein [Clostridia bacterium]
MILDNFNFFRNRMHFTKKGDYYVICIAVRRKDINKSNNKVSSILLENNGTFFSPYFKLYLDLDKQLEIQKNNSRVILNYFIYSFEDYDTYKKEIIAICKILNARAYFFDCKQNNYYTYTLVEKSVTNEENINKAKCWIDTFNIINVPENSPYFIDLDDGDDIDFYEDIKKNLGIFFLYEIKTPNGIHLVYDRRFFNYNKLPKSVVENKIHYLVCTILYYNDEEIY